MPANPAERLRFALTPPQAVSHASAVVYRPPSDGGRAAFVLAHGAGADLTNQLLRSVARGVAGRGYPVLTFNFGYAEAGRKRPDPAARLEVAFRDALRFARTALFADRPLLLGGRSMGGRIASHLAVQGEPCAGLAFLGYPLHPPGEGRPGSAAAGRQKVRTAHWPQLRVPLLFVQGDRDRLCDLDLLARERAANLQQASPSRLHVVRNGDHGFSVPAADGRPAAEVRAEVVRAVADWADGLQLP
ncbi:MAG: hypothetical protein H0V93_16795 [Euzebyales bacterium]|nr:hypothetical protein [Euzebyales bacterium]